MHLSHNIRLHLVNNTQKKKKLQKSRTISLQNVEIIENKMHVWKGTSVHLCTMTLVKI